MHNEFIDYFDQETRLRGYLAFDDQLPEPLPAVLITHAWAGRDEFVNEKANWLAEQGYAAFALDTYGKDTLGTSNEENERLMKPFIEDRNLLLQRIAAGLATLENQPMVDTKKIAVMGYCFGGLCALDLARSGTDIKGAISIHGLLNPPADVPHKTIKAKILALHGQDDPMCPPEMVQAFANEMTAAKADWQINIYGNTQHAFTNPNANSPEHGLQFSETANHRAERTILTFLEEVFI
jgi:dienelactone hydrolase